MSAEPNSVPPFPTRYPTRPPLVLTRRARGSSAVEWAQTFSPAPEPGGDVERVLRQMEQALAERERVVTEAEVRLAERTRDLDEMEALLRARETLLASTRLRDLNNSRGVVTEREAQALRKLQEELDRQEASLREARQALHDREKFLEESETRLFEKVQQQQEKESELEQREENLGVRAAAVANGAKRPYDEFRE